MKSISSIFLMGVCTLSLSACGTFLDTREKENLPLADTQGAMSASPDFPSAQPSKGEYISSNSSVDVLDYNWNGSVGIANDFGAPQQEYNQSDSSGVQMGDSSVTVYPIGGAPASMAQAYGQADYGSQNYMSYGNTGNGNQIYFKHGSSRLGGGDMTKLNQMAEQAKFAPVSRITVEGYASQPTQAGQRTVESEILNLKESMNRSFAVSKTLMQKGVPAEKLKTVSWGSTKTSGNEQQDRRVDISMGER